MKIEITILPNGSIMVEKGSPEHNAMLLEMLDKCSDDDSLSQFIDLSRDDQLLFGKSFLCG